MTPGCWYSSNSRNWEVVFSTAWSNTVETWRHCPISRRDSAHCRAALVSLEASPPYCWGASPRPARVADKKCACVCRAEMGEEGMGIVSLSQQQIYQATHAGRGSTGCLSPPFAGTRAPRRSAEASKPPEEQEREDGLRAGPPSRTRRCSSSSRAWRCWLLAPEVGKGKEASSSPSSSPLVPLPIGDRQVGGGGWNGRKGGETTNHGGAGVPAAEGSGQLKHRRGLTRAASRLVLASLCRGKGYHDVRESPTANFRLSDRELCRPKVRHVVGWWAGW